MQRSRNYISLLCFALLVALASSCASSKTAKTNDPLEKATGELVNERQEIKVERMFMDAQRAKILDDPEEALRLFSRVVALDNENHAAHYELGYLYYAAGNFERALIHSEKAAVMDPSNSWYLLLYADILSVEGEYVKAAELYEQVLELQPQQYENYFQLAVLYIKSREPEKAVSAYERLEQVIGPDENILLNKHKLYITTGDVEKAEQCLRDLITLNPDDPDYYNMLAEMYDRLGNEEKTLEIYDEILQKRPNNPYVLLALSDYHRKRGELDLQTKYLRKVFGNADLDVDIKIGILFPYARFYEQKKDEIDVALELADSLVVHHSEEAKAYAMKGDLLYMDGQNEEALATYYTSLELQQDIYSVWQQVMTINAEMEEYESLIEWSKEAAAVFPNQATNYFFRGIGHQQLKDYEDASSMFDRTILMSIDNAPLKAQAYSSLGDVFYELEDHRASDSCFDESLLLRPDNPYVLNNYGYYLSLRGEKLNQAEKMILYAMELAGENEAYLDTYAWILYKQEKFKEAEEVQLQALELDENNSAVLLEHMGDILFKQNKVDQAISYWKQAKEAGGDSESLNKKIESRELHD